MKKTIVFPFILFLLLQIEAEAQTYSILTGIVTEVHSRWLAIKSDEGEIVQLRVGSRTIYPTRIPVTGDKVKVEYLINRGVYIGFSVVILESVKKEIESRPKLPSDLPPEISGFVGKWEGAWDNRKDMHFTLTIPNINLEVAEVKYESRDEKFSETAKVIRSEKTRIEWIKSKISSAGVQPMTWYTFELQNDGTLKGTFDIRGVRGFSMKTVMKRVD